MSLANGQHDVAELLNKLRLVCRVLLFCFHLFFSHTISEQSMMTNDNLVLSAKRILSVHYCHNDMSCSYS